jgi:hypothetical protein
MERPVRTGRRAAGAGLDALGHQFAADVLGGQVTAGALRPPPLGRLDLRPAASGAEGRPDPLGPDLRCGGLENRYARDSGPSCGTARGGTWTHRRWKRPAPTATPVHADRDRSKVSPAGGRAAKACLDILRGAQPPQGGPCWERQHGRLLDGRESSALVSASRRSFLAHC